jgi:hypothetical protein
LHDSTRLLVPVSTYCNGHMAVAGALIWQLNAKA